MEIGNINLQIHLLKPYFFFAIEYLKIITFFSSDKLNCLIYIVYIYIYHNAVIISVIVMFKFIL